MVRYRLCMSSLLREFILLIGGRVCTITVRSVVTEACSLVMWTEKSHTLNEPDRFAISPQSTVDTAHNCIGKYRVDAVWTVDPVTGWFGKDL
jgi:hypothetical protein